MSLARRGHRLEDVSPGDTITIRGIEYPVGSYCERINPPDGLVSLFIQTPDENRDDDLTGHTVARLYVDREPYELHVCNGPTHEIEPDEVEVLGG